MSDQRELHMVQKFLGLVGRMRKHQRQYFKTKMDYDKKMSMRYEKEVDDYIKLLLKSGLTPIFDGDAQNTMF
jgi:hypothetical protein